MFKRVMLIVGFLTVFALASGGDRVERLSTQNTDGGVAKESAITVWHDKDSGVEIICRELREEKSAMSLERANSVALAVSCVPTGRKW